MLADESMKEPEPITLAAPEPEITADWQKLPAGDYAIVEFFGHTTMVGRIAEVERFGTKFLALEPLFNGVLLDPVFNGGASIYRLTPCSRQVAWERQARDSWQLPTSVRVTVLPAMLPGPDSEAATDVSEEEMNGEDEQDLS